MPIFLIATRKKAEDYGRSQSGNIWGVGAAVFVSFSLFVYGGNHRRNRQFLVCCVHSVFSRLIVCALMIDGPGMAKREGLGYLFAKTLAKKDFAVLIGYLLCFFIAVPMIPGLPAVYLLMALSSIFLYLYARRFFLQSFGGLTGDSFGAVIEGSETVLWMVTWLLLLYVMG